MKALSESERCQYRWAQGQTLINRCNSVVEYRIMVTDPAPRVFDLCAHHTTMTEDTLAMLHIGHGRQYIGIGSTRRDGDDPRLYDSANDGALDARMESQP